MSFIKFLVKFCKNKEKISYSFLCAHVQKPALSHSATLIIKGLIIKRKLLKALNLKLFAKTFFH